MKRLILFSLTLFFLVACEKDPIPPATPTITTGNAGNVGTTTATVSWSVSDISNSIEIGVLYSSSSTALASTNAQKVSISNFKTGDNSVTITGLSAGKLYFYMPYTTDGYAFIYGDVKTFTTSIDYATVTTNSVSNITSTQASCGGNITNNGGGNITARGVCWGTSPNPTISNNKTSDGTGTGSFTSSITGLQAETTYYVRAYITNEKGLAYGSTISFKTTKATGIQSKNGYTLTQNETWSGTITLKGDIVVPSGITLTINPGTIINISTDAPLYDGGLSPSKIEFSIRGSLIINGTAQNIVQIKSATGSPTNDDWDGITMSGNQLDIGYCSISDSHYGIFHSSSSTAAMKIKNCLFTNIGSAIVDFGSQQHSLSYNSFFNVWNGYTLRDSNRIIQLNYSEFKNNTNDVGIAGTSTYEANYSSISINYSNFSDNKWFNLYWSPDGGVTNSSITANYCYGITTYQTNGYGNTYTPANQLSTPYSNAGCGFSSTLKSAYSRSNQIVNPDLGKSIMKEHIEEIIRHNAEMKRQ